MRFYEYGDRNLPPIMLIHGAGWSYWLYLREARLLQERYHVILPVLDGHGEESGTPYTSTEKTADKLMAYINHNCGGQLFALGGVSLGGQIAIELLSRKKDIAQKAIVESAICIPQPFLMQYSIKVYKLFGKMMFSRGFNQWALKTLPKRLRMTPEIEALYLRDVTSVKIETLTNVFKTYFNYTMKESLKDSHVDTQYWYGSREMKCIKQSSKLFQTYVNKCNIVALKGYVHSEISAYHPEEWVQSAEAFFMDNE